MSRLTLEKAKEILKKHTTEDHLFIYAQSVSAAMGSYRLAPGRGL